MKMPTDCAAGSQRFADANRRYCERLGFGIGKRVRRGRSIRRIEAIYSDIWGGVRLDREIGGFVSWNIADLTKAPSTPKTPSDQRED